MLFNAAYLTALDWIVSTLIYQVGRLLGFLGGRKTLFGWGHRLILPGCCSDLLGLEATLTAKISRDLKELAPSGCFEFPVGRLSNYVSSHSWILESHLYSGPFLSSSLLLKVKV